MRDRQGGHHLCVMLAAGKSAVRDARLAGGLYTYRLETQHGGSLLPLEVLGLLHPQGRLPGILC